MTIDPDHSGIGPRYEAGGENRIRYGHAVLPCEQSMAPTASRYQCDRNCDVVQQVVQGLIAECLFQGLADNITHPEWPSTVQHHGRLEHGSSCCTEPGRFELVGPSCSQECSNNRSGTGAGVYRRLDSLSDQFESSTHRERRAPRATLEGNTQCQADQSINRSGINDPEGSTA